MEKRKSIKNYIFTIAMVILVVALILIPYIAEKNAKSSNNEASVLTGTVELDSISTTVSGAGTLTEEDAEDVSIADGVTVTKYLVSNGDTVKEGDALAAVDRTSVLVAISNVYDSMAEILDEINDCKSDKLQEVLYSTCNGTVKAIYAQPGDSVRDVMTQYGCLAIIERTNGDDLKVTAAGGTVQSVNIHEGGHIYYGTNLFILTDVDSTGAAELLAEQYREYEDMSLDLFKMYQSGTITAPCDGVVSGIDEDAAKELEKNYTQHVISASETAYYQTGTTIEQIAAYLDDSSQNVIHAHEVAYVSTDEVVYAHVTKNSDGKIVILDANDSTRQLPDEAISGLDESMRGSYYKITIQTWTDDATGELKPDNNPTYIAEFMFKVEETDSKQSTGDNTGNNSTPSGMSAGGGMSAGVSMSVASTDSEDEFTYFSVEETTILSVTPQDTVTIPITVDELDILSIHVGDQATVTIDALTGRSFEGTVTEIDTSGETNSGGNSKYSATITLDRTEDMLGGMNASVLITVETKDNIPVIPVEALVESGTKTLVYTAQDQSGQPANPVEVETGISDGSKVEIVSGLTAGETIVYSYYDTLSIEGLGSNTGSGINFDFGGGGGGGPRR